ncbi:MAG: hypothetical protein KatS3mg023_3609 [Armatimonadota bacterium]|nr:MAG: hypothetical protein KatS3mg023_3609 [Armatimonadota bacterium]
MKDSSRKLSEIERLAQMELPVDELDDARHSVTVERFEQRINKILSKVYRQHLVPPKEVQTLARQALEILRDGSLQERRTTGMAVLSGLINRAYCEHLDDDGNFRPLELRYGKHLPDNYSTYIPSTTIADAHPDAELLLIGEAPAFAETKIGVPLADLWNVTGSLCGVCVNFQRCFFNTVLVKGKTAPQFEQRLYGCEFSEAPEHLARVARVNAGGMTCYTAGEVLRKALVHVGIGRNSWGEYLNQTRCDVLAVATNVLRETTLAPSDKGMANQSAPDQKYMEHADWLWLEAAMMAPRATVLLGGKAMLGYCTVTGSKRTKGSGLLDYHHPFGMVYRTYHPAALMRQFSVWQVEDELRRAFEDKVTRQQVNENERWQARAMLVHLVDALLAAKRYCLKPDPLDSKSAGYNQIIPSYLTSQFADRHESDLEQD